MKKTFITTTFALLLLTPLLVGAEASATTTVATTTVSTTTDQVSTTAISTSTIAKNFTQCQQASIEKRDTSIASARTVYNQAMATALTTRKDAEKATVALTNSEENKLAVKAIFETYKKATRSAQATLTATRKTVWATFETDTKTCRKDKKTAQYKIEAVKEKEDKEGIDKKKNKNSITAEQQKDEHISDKKEFKSLGEELKEKLESLRKRVLMNKEVKSSETH